MTEYGQGPGPRPWHPEDPLYGEGRSGGQPGTYQGEWDHYGEQQGAYGEQYEGQYMAQYQQQPAAYGQGYDPAYDPYATGQLPPQPYAQPQQPQHQQTQPSQQQQGYYQGGGWDGMGDTGAGAGYDPSAYGAAATGPYGMPVVDPYGTGPQPAYPGYADHYAQPGAYPPPQPQHLRPQQPFPGPPPGQTGPVPPGRPGAPQPGPDDLTRAAGPDPETGWDPGPDQGEHAFFTESDEEDAWPGDEEGDSRGEDRRGSRTGRGGATKRKSGCAIVAASVVLTGGLGAVGYFGYSFYEAHFAAAPDYPGSGSGRVQVTIPGGASIADMGETLQSAGVVKSPGAFIEAANAEKKASNIQPGAYSLRKKMSGKSAVSLMLSPASQNTLIIPEGARASKVYGLVDKKLGSKPGTTRAAAEAGGLGLPSWARNKPEGFLFPSRYSIGEKGDEAGVLRQMVARAKSEQAKDNLSAAAKKVGKTPEQILTIASLIQAEAREGDEFGKVSRVIYNRLDKGMLLGFDSTINYAKGRSSLNTSVQDTKVDSSYNTYTHHGLPPGPIDNPGHEAIQAALHPVKGDWLYFVTVKPGDTRFTASKAQHDRNVRDFNIEQRRKGSGG
jgi:uncharacterized YceG family protein